MKKLRWIIFFCSAVVICCGFCFDNSAEMSKRKALARSVFGRIQFVNVGEDVRVKVVNVGEDLRVRIVDTGEDRVGAWKIVDVAPKWRVRIVDVGEDFRVRFVSVGEG